MITNTCPNDGTPSCAGWALAAGAARTPPHMARPRAARIPRTAVSLSPGTMRLQPDEVWSVLTAGDAPQVDEQGGPLSNGAVIDLGVGRDQHHGVGITGG